VVGIWDDDVGSVGRSCADVIAPAVSDGDLRGSWACNVAPGCTKLGCPGVSWPSVGGCLVHESVARPRG